MPTPLIDIDGLPLLGHEERMPDLIEWARKVGPSQKWVEETAFGLRIAFSSGLAHDTTWHGVPKAYIYWNNAKFLNFLSRLGKIDSLRLFCYGVEVYYTEERLRVGLPNTSEKSIYLWDSLEKEFCRELQSPKSDNNFFWLTGVISFMDTGPLFYEQTECPEELEEVSALAIIRKEEPRKLSEAPLRPVPSLPSNNNITSLEELKSKMVEIVKGKRV